MNFTFVVSKPPDLTFGALKPDGSWTGMIGELINQNADMGIVFERLEITEIEHFQQRLCCGITLHSTLVHIYFFFISAIAPFIVTYQRAQAISYSHSLNNVHDLVAIKNPTDTFNFGAYTEPLRLWSWIFIGIFCIVCPPFLYFTAR